MLLNASFNTRFYSVRYDSPEYSLHLPLGRDWKSPTLSRVVHELHESECIKNINDFFLAATCITKADAINPVRPSETWRSGSTLAKERSCCLDQLPEPILTSHWWCYMAFIVMRAISRVPKLLYRKMSLAIVYPLLELLLHLPGANELIIKSTV